MEQILLLNHENASEFEVETYNIRKAARAIVIDKENKIALLNVSKLGYYKLPGGGIEEGEDIIEALKRECLEEIGCNVEVLNEVGMITEYRKYMKLKQISYCYIAKVVGEKGEVDLSESEKENEFKQVWLTYYEALEAMKRSKSADLEGSSYIVPRDSKFLEEAGRFL